MNNTRVPKLRFYYDAMGNRVVKENLINNTKEIYVRDAQGNVIVVYEIKKKNNIDSLFTNEFHIFGSNRLGYLMDKKYLARKTYGKTLGGAIPALPVNPIISIPNPFILPGTTSITLLYFGNKRYELSDWLGNVRVVINDKKTPVNSGTTTVSYLPQVMSVSDYYSFGSQIAERSYDPVKPLYRFGFNTQEKVNEISPDHYTAKYWEYDARLGRRWNVDPKPQVGVSDYACLGNNPIWFSDVFGDTIRLNKEGFENVQIALKGILGNKESPINFDEKRGVLTYNNKLDISNYSDFQKEILNRYKTLINHETDINLKIVDEYEKVIESNNNTFVSLFDIKSVGVTVPYKINNKIAFQNVYVARNPVKSDGTPEKKEYAGIVNLHELLGHAFLNITQPHLTKVEHNKLVEEFHLNINKNFRVNGALWYKNSPVPKHE